jgi:orotate phosphoribosyltransferase
MSYKKEFIEFMVRSGVLTFGDFTTKSGRKTPYFVNTGNYKTGEQAARLGEFYAQCIKENVKEEIVALFGPAYKGIPLSVATAIALSNKFNKNVNYCFNKEDIHACYFTYLFFPVVSSKHCCYGKNSFIICCNYLFL